MSALNDAKLRKVLLMSVTPLVFHAPIARQSELGALLQESTLHFSWSLQSSNLQFESPAGSEGQARTTESNQHARIITRACREAVRADPRNDVSMHGFGVRKKARGWDPLQQERPHDRE
eukprot:3299087-Rhodomonas_salina.1